MTITGFSTKSIPDNDLLDISNIPTKNEPIAETDLDKELLSQDEKQSVDESKPHRKHKNKKKKLTSKKFEKIKLNHDVKEVNEEVDSTFYKNNKLNKDIKESNEYLNNDLKKFKKLKNFIYNEKIGVKNETPIFKKAINLKLNSSIFTPIHNKKSIFKTVNNSRNSFIYQGFRSKQDSQEKCSLFSDIHFPRLSIDSGSSVPHAFNQSICSKESKTRKQSHSVVPSDLESILNFREFSVSESNEFQSAINELKSKADASRFTDRKIRVEDKINKSLCFAKKLYHGE